MYVPGTPHPIVPGIPHTNVPSTPHPGIHGKTHPSVSLCQCAWYTRLVVTTLSLWSTHCLLTFPTISFISRERTNHIVKQEAWDCTSVYLCMWWYMSYFGGCICFISRERTNQIVKQEMQDCTSVYLTVYIWFVKSKLKHNQFTLVDAKLKKMLD